MLFGGECKFSQITSYCCALTSFGAAKTYAVSMPIQTVQPGFQVCPQSSCGPASRQKTNRRYARTRGIQDCLRTDAGEHGYFGLRKFSRVECRDPPSLRQNQRKQTKGTKVFSFLYSPEGRVIRVPGWEEVSGTRVARPSETSRLTRFSTSNPELRWASRASVFRVYRVGGILIQDLAWITARWLQPRRNKAPRRNSGPAMMR